MWIHERHTAAPLAARLAGVGLALFLLVGCGRDSASPGIASTPTAPSPAPSPAPAPSPPPAPSPAPAPTPAPPPAPAAPVRIMPLGDSITQADASHDSYRRPLWKSLQSGGYLVDFVGSSSMNHMGGPPVRDFDADHEGHWGWRADEIES